MALGPGFGEGFTSGLQSGSEMMQARARMRALQQEQLDKKLDFYSSAADAQIQHIQAIIANAPQRDANLDKTVAALAAPVQELAKGITQLPTQKAQVLSQAISSGLATAMQTPTMSEKTTNEYKAKEASFNQLYPDTAQPTQAAAATPSPGLPTPPPSAPDQQMAGGIGATPATPVSPAAGAMPTAPAAPPSAGVTDQATASQGIPSQPMGPQAAQGGAPAAPAPGTPAEQPTPDQTATPLKVPLWDAVSAGQVPTGAVEYLVLHPETKDKFEQTFGVDATSLLSADQGEGAPKPSRDQLKRQFFGIPETAGEKAYAEADAKQRVKDQGLVGDAKKMIALNAQAREQLDQGIYAGLLSGPQLMAARVAEAAGVASPEQKRLIKNTMAYQNGMKRQTAIMIKSFGAGTGLSDADRQFAWEAVGGNTAMPADALEHLLDINSQMALFTMLNPRSLQTPDEIAADQKKYSGE